MELSYENEIIKGVIHKVTIWINRDHIVKNIEIWLPDIINGMRLLVYWFP